MNWIFKPKEDECSIPLYGLRYGFGEYTTLTIKNSYNWLMSSIGSRTLYGGVFKTDEIVSTVVII